MLPEVRLDINHFKEIVEESRNMIAGIYPEWTDYNYHDPGITLLELLAWLEELQQYHLDQVGREHQNKFLKLLGIRPEGRSPAMSLVEITGSRPLYLKKGAKFYADQFCFETLIPEYVPGLDVTGCITRNGREETVLDQRQMGFNGRMKLYPFGKRPTAGNTCFLCIGQAPETGRKGHISLTVYDGYDVKRNPVDNDFPFPLADIAWEYYGSEGFRTLTVHEDKTWGLLQSGRLCVETDTEMAWTEMAGMSGYFIRMVLLSQNYDVAPILTGISISQVEVAQQDTKATCCFLPIERDEIGAYFLTDLAMAGSGRGIYYLTDGEGRLFPCACTKAGEQNGEYCFRILAETDNRFHVLAAFYENSFYPHQVLAVGNGFPNQRYSIEAECVIRESFVIAAEDILKQGVFHIWQQVDDFDFSSPEDLHYVLDTAQGEVRFGDSIHGMAPETEIRILSYVESMGEPGNVKSGKIRTGRDLPEGVVAVNVTDARGGRAEEQLESCFARARQSMKNMDRAVTASDYENLIRKVPGLMIQSCKALHAAGVETADKNNTVKIVVRPFSNGTAVGLNEVYRKNILAFLDSRRLLGTRIHLYGPEFVELVIYVEVTVNPQYLKAREQVLNAIDSFFKKREGEFGLPVRHGQLYGYLDSLESVREIRMLTVEARGNRIRRNKSGDVIPPQNGVFLLKRAECTITNGAGQKG